MDNQDTHAAGKIREEEVAGRVAEVLGRISDIDATQVQCTLGVVVMKPEEGSDKNGVHVFAIGDNEEIMRMVMQLIESSRDGIRAAEAKAEEAEETNHSGVLH